MITESILSGRPAIRQRISEEYQSYYALGGNGGYRGLGRAWGVSTGVAHSLVNIGNYWPSDTGIVAALEAAAAERGILVRRRGRKPDLFSMDPALLLWKLINREEV